MNIEITNLTGRRIDEKYFQKAGEMILRKLKQPEDAEISLVFVEDAEMKKLNKKYRRQNKTTDVLSFAYQEEKIPPNPPLEKGGKSLPPFAKEGWGGFLGEIVISVPQARRQCLRQSHGGQAKKQVRLRQGSGGRAKKRSYPLKRELTELFVHGILHLVGYEDETEKEYNKMMRKQEKLLNFLASSKYQ